MRTAIERAASFASSRSDGRFEPAAVVLCGDLGVTQGSPVYQLVKDSALDQQNLTQLENIKQFRVFDTQLPYVRNKSLE